MQINDNIKLIRELSGKTQAEFAKLIKTKLSNLKTYETTDVRPKAPVIAAILDFTGLSEEDLDKRKLTHKDIKPANLMVENDQFSHEKKVDIVQEHPDTRDLIRVLKQQNEILQRDKERLFTIIEVSLAPLVDMVEWQRAATAAGLEWEALKAGSRTKAAEVSGKLDRLIQKNQEAWKKRGKVPREDSVSIP